METEDKHQVYEVVIESENSDNNNVFIAPVHVVDVQGRDEDMLLCDTTHIERWQLVDEGGATLSELVSHFRFRVSYDEEENELNLEIDVQYKSDGKWRSVLKDDIMVLPTEVGQSTYATIANILSPYFKKGGTVSVTKKKTEPCKGCVQKKGMDHILPIHASRMKGKVSIEKR